ncbi:MAG TPA: hypothetical protein VGL94_20015 [Ktedonobacteraceae bacterium]|jgi:hypothetical protein
MKKLWRFGKDLGKSFTSKGDGGHPPKRSARDQSLQELGIPRSHWEQQARNDQEQWESEKLRMQKEEEREMLNQHRTNQPPSNFYENRRQINRQDSYEVHTETESWTNGAIHHERYKAAELSKKLDQEFSVKRKKISYLKDFPVEQFWRLCVDKQYQHDNGPAFIVDDEPSFIAGTKRLFNAMLDGLCIEETHRAKKLTGQYFEQMHDIAIADTYRKVREGNKKEKFRLGYRKYDNNGRTSRFGWDGANGSKSGLKELQEKYACRSKNQGGNGDLRYGDKGHPVGNNCLDPSLDTYYYRTTNSTPEECLAIANTIIDKYYAEIDEINNKEEISKSTNDDDKLTAIVGCCQDLNQAHLFYDGNIRTIAFGVLPKLLLENGFCPTILHDPNILDGYSIAEIKNAIREGQEYFRSLCSSNESQ